MFPDEVHRTELDGMQVVWQLRRCRITIISISSSADGIPLVSFAPGRLPDLARAREQLPQLSALWDAVRRDLWEQLMHRPFLPSLRM
ncbi:hypothetical protein CRH09_18210 [Nocardia terpenica]|uniref:Uncharacterized protein n=1 Tax=Nocardia terpenica TaxID=455432 RepID=A0A291RKL3_9NOCA|nr:hypothetical protein CRH09_18210 [Nocardia terpenica]